MVSDVTYTLIFDKVIVKQLQQEAKNQHIKSILTNLLDKLETHGPRAGKLLDSQLFIYEIRNKQPPIRLYFKHNSDTNEIYVFEYEMKTGGKKQRRTISKLRKKVADEDLES